MGVSCIQNLQGERDQQCSDYTEMAALLRAAESCSWPALGQLWHNMRRKLRMTGPRHRSAWIWLAVATMTVVLLARAQATIQIATAYTNPVFEFLASHQSSGLHGANDNPRNFEYRFGRQTRGILLFASLRDGADSGGWQAIMPVFFIGLVVPLSLASPRSFDLLGRAPAAPALPFSFQRPPPQLLS
jgi:hypothetical protein